MSSIFYKFFIKNLNFYFPFLLYILIMKDKIIKDFLENLNFSEKSKLKEMLSHNITCYSDFAKENNIDVLEFNNELKRQLGVINV